MPEFSHKVLQLITDSTIGYLQQQVHAGADMVQIFDSWAGILSPQQYGEFALPYVAKICDALEKMVPVTVFAKGAFFARAKMNNLNCNVVGLDWNMDACESRRLIPDKVLQGNLDPCALYGSFEEIRKETNRMLKDFGGSRHIANLGHGLYPDISVDKVKCFIDTVKEFQPA